MPGSLRHTLDEAVNTSFSKFWPCVPTFLIFYHRKTSTPEALMLHLSTRSVSQKSTLRPNSKPNSSFLFPEHHFYLKRTTDKNLLFRIRDLPSILSNRTKSLSLLSFRFHTMMACQKQWPVKFWCRKLPIIKADCLHSHPTDVNGM